MSACEECVRPIGGSHLAYAGDGDGCVYRVFCGRCLRDRPWLHDKYWPDCGRSWHDNYDHIRFVVEARNR